jgi:hypothetical protein
MRKISNKKYTNSFITDDGKIFQYEGQAREHELHLAKDRLSQLNQHSDVYAIGEIVSFYTENDSDIEILQKCFSSSQMYSEYIAPIWLHVWNDQIISVEDLKDLINQDIKALKNLI